VIEQVPLKTGQGDKSVKIHNNKKTMAKLVSSNNFYAALSFQN